MCQKQQHSPVTVDEVLHNLTHHRLPKIDENLAHKGISRIEIADFKREGRYTRVVILGDQGKRIGVGIAHRSLDDPEDPALGLKLAFERAVHEYIHGQPNMQLEISTKEGKAVNDLQSFYGIFG